MIERDHDEGGYYICCDTCSNDINIQQDDFTRAIEALKMRGWKIIKIHDPSPNIDTQWRHICPTCQKV